MSDSTFLWQDFETFGADPRRDRPAQFAALRSNEALEPIGEPIVLFCRPADDVLPQPAACLITGITPQMAAERGLPENEFAERVHAAMSQPGTCSVGYNNFRFDDEVSRFLFWRNFFDPYAREYSHGNTRFDLIDLLRMTRALRPEGLVWADRADGSPSFRLEDLARANGLDTSRAHDALADVEVTLELARRLKQKHCRLWDWALSLRHKHTVAGLLEARTPLLHSSARFPAELFATAPILPLGPHPAYSSQWIIWNLQHSPEPFLDMTVEALSDRLWVSQADLPEGEQRLPIKLIRSNRCPMLAPMNVLDDAARDRLAIEPSQINEHAELLQRQPDFQRRLSALFEPAASDHAKPGNDAELALYDAFVPRSDQRLFPAVRQADAETLIRMGSPFQDERLNELLFRYRARLYPGSLDSDERSRWADYRQRRLVEDNDLASISWPEFQAELTQRLRAEPEHGDLLSALAEWGQALNIDQQR